MSLCLELLDSGGKRKGVFRINTWEVEIGSLQFERCESLIF
jgi:hypothetical protein